MSRQYPSEEPMEENEGFFKTLGSHAPFHVADFEAIISIFKIIWSTILRIGWKGYVIYKTHSQTSKKEEGCRHTFAEGSKK